MSPRRLERRGWRACGYEGRSGHKNSWYILSDLGRLIRSTDVETRRRRNHTELALHLVWTTWKRMPLIRDEELERCLWRTIQAEAEKQGCQVLAIGGMPDHIHVVLVHPLTISVSRLLNQLKGGASSVARERLGVNHFFKWAEGYAAFSLSSTHCRQAIAYVKRQKEHHSLNDLWERWEETPDLELWQEP